MALTPGQTTLATILLSARERADMVNSLFVSDAEFTRYIQASQAELYDLLVQKYGDNYAVANGSTPYTFTTDGTTDQYPLPDGSSTYTLSTGAPAQAFYKMLGVDLLQSGNQLYSLTIKPFQFAERNRWAWPNMQSLYGLVNLMYRINGNFLWLIPRAAGGQTIRLQYVPRLTPLSQTGTITLSGVIAGDSVTINGTVFLCVAAGATVNQFNVGGTDTISATNLAAVITAAGLGMTAAGVATVVTVTLTTATAITWSTSNVHMAVGPALTFTTILDGVSGWEEYVVVDAAIKAMAKEESDPSVLMAQKQGLLQRIESAAENRDAGSPARVSDSRGADFERPPGWGWGTF